MSEIKAWRVRASRTLYQDPWVRMRGDECETTPGHVLGAYHVLEYRDWTHAVALDAEGRIVLVRQYRHGYGGLSLELPGGMMDPATPMPPPPGARAGGGDRLCRAVDPPCRGAVAQPATHANRLHVALAEGVTPTGRRHLDGSGGDRDRASKRRRGGAAGAFGRHDPGDACRADDDRPQRRRTPEGRAQRHPIERRPAEEPASASSDEALAGIQNQRDAGEQDGDADQLAAFGLLAERKRDSATVARISTRPSVRT